MNPVSIRLSTIALSLIIIQSISSHPNKLDEPDITEISNRFSDLLDSLVKVNMERVDTLKKLFKLYDVNDPKQTLRINEQRDDYSEERDAYPENDNSLTRTEIRSCSCQNRDYEDDDNDIIYLYDVQRPWNLKRTLIEDYLQNHNKPANVATETDQMERKQHTNKRNIKSTKTNSSRHKVLKPQLKAKFSGKKINNNKPMKSTLCIGLRRAYEDCKRSCRDAFRKSCVYSHCSEHFYKNVKSQCRHECNKRFIKPNDDYDYDYY